MYKLSTIEIEFDPSINRRVYGPFHCSGLVSEVASKFFITTLKKTNLTSKARGTV